MSNNKITQRARDRRSFIDWYLAQRFLTDDALIRFHANATTLLGMLCNHGRFEDVCRVFQGVDDLAPDWGGWTPLHYFCEWFSPSYSDAWGDRTWTPAAASALHLLLDNGEDLFRPDTRLRDAVTGFDMASQELLLDAWHYLLARPRNGDQQVMFLCLHEQFETRSAVTNGMRDYIRSCLHHHDGSFRACLEECMELPATPDAAAAAASE
jgi:pentatricopeptide repeat protein